MKSVTVHFFDKHSGASYSGNITWDKFDKSKVKKQFEDLESNVPFTKYYAEAIDDSDEPLTEEEQNLLVEMEYD